MASKPSSGKSSESLSRSKTSRDEVRSLADEMLRASLTRGAASATSVSNDASKISSPPPYSRSVAAPFSSASRPHIPADMLSRERNPGAARAPNSGATITRDTKGSSASSASSEVPIAAADTKTLKYHLQQQMEKENAGVPHKATGG